VCQASLDAMGLTAAQLSIAAKPASVDDIKALLTYSDEVMVY
jgi:sulfur relay (sulfurtransferase) DsrF/TusC family protein